MGEINKKTTVTLPVVIIIVAAAVAWGVLTTIVTSMGVDIDDLKEQVESLDIKIDQILVMKETSLVLK